MPQPQLLIFDCDGVLIDSEVVAAKVEAELLRDEGIEIEASELTTRFAGLTFAATMARLSEETGHRFSEAFLKRVDDEIDRRLATEAEEIAGAHDMLDRLDLPRCICSNSTAARLEMELDHVGLWDRFRPYVFSAVDVGQPKPAPDVFRHALKVFDVPGHAAVVIEDSVHGVQGAKAAGCRVVGFTGAGHSYLGHADALTEAGAETVISRLADFPALVEVLAVWQDD
ncbi:HAD family phosphatase [Jiella sp. MQZ9-1]|uniref:HAD family phosphatase n=1 Tax=Jiella flava TaxID=2816857 RepID=A0A939FV70_9HYPH|nr:HAD family phosphatase [Jiella flava]MBO0662025.1 HAD family phosphatase [Jiella flava]MCD2470648.1 HAD family phosphatase [Jiella flava]